MSIWNKPFIKNIKMTELACENNQILRLTSVPLNSYTTRTSIEIPGSIVGVTASLVKITIPLIETTQFPEKFAHTRQEKQRN